MVRARFRLSLIVTVLLSLFATVPPIRAGVPQSLCVQGYLENLNHVPVNGTVPIEVCLYDAAVGGNQVWPAPPNCFERMVPVTNGLFTVDLGNADLGPEDFTADRWLQFATNNQTMSPRVQLRTTPYAFRAGTVDSIPNPLSLGCGTSGNPGLLQMCNGQSPNRDTITLEGSDPQNAGRIFLRNALGNPGVRISGDTPGPTPPGFGGGIQLYKRAGGLSINIEAGANSPLELYNNSGQITFHAQSDDGGYGTAGGDGGSILKMYNGQSPNRETITLDANDGAASSRLSLRDASGAETVIAYARASTGASSLELRDPSGHLRAELKGWVGGNSPSSALRLYDEDGVIQRLNLEGGANASCICEDNGGTVAWYNADGMSTGYVSGGLAGGGARLTLTNGQSPNQETIRLQGNSAAGSGRIAVNNGAGTTLVEIIGDDPGVPNNDDALISVLGKITCRKLCSGQAAFNAGCDLAETFDHSDPDTVQPGMVMVIDSAKSGHLRIADKAYDRKVAGIISGAGGLNPGVKLGQRADGSDDLPLALSGRVYCYVDTTREAVEVGDLLTTSDTPGHAMKASDRDRAFGAVLGKTMEPLPKGKKGLVLVLVALQ